MIGYSRCSFCKHCLELIEKEAPGLIDGSKVKLLYVRCKEYGLRLARKSNSNPKGEGCTKFRSKADVYILDMENWSWRVSK